MTANVDNSVNRKADKNIYLLLQGWPLAAALIGSMVAGVMMWSTLQATVMAQGKKQVESSEVQVAQGDRIRTLEQGQAVINERLKNIQENQKRAVEQIERGQQQIMEQLRAPGRRQ